MARVKMKEILLTGKKNMGLQIALGDDLHTLEHAQGGTWLYLPLIDSKRLILRKKEIMGHFREHLFTLEN